MAPDAWLCIGHREGLVVLIPGKFSMESGWAFYDNAVHTLSANDGGDRLLAGHLYQHTAPGLPTTSANLQSSGPSPYYHIVQVLTALDVMAQGAPLIDYTALLAGVEMERVLQEFTAMFAVIPPAGRINFMQKLQTAMDETEYIGTSASAPLPDIQP